VKKISILLLILTSIAYCHSSSSANLLVDSKHPSVVIKIAENRTTGYVCQPMKNNSKSVKISELPYVNDTKLMGAPGYSQWKIEFVHNTFINLKSPKTIKLKWYCGRAWEKGHDPDFEKVYSVEMLPLESEHNSMSREYARSPKR
jgi:predicted secreted protein